MSSKRDNQGNLSCSFCGKSQKEVKKLIAGPSVYICDECISLCNDILAEEVQKVFPEVVFSDESGQVVGMDYARLSAVSICAVKELNRTIEDQRNQIEQLEEDAAEARAENDDLRARLERLESMMAAAQ